MVGRADYNEWGEVTYKEALSITSSYRRIWPQLNYTGYDWDDVLGMYYAKARFYSADDKRFVAIDPIKGQITDPLSLVSYLYCVDNPLRWTDPLGMKAQLAQYEVTGGVVNFRAESNLNADVLDTLPRGARAKDLGRRVTADGYTWANVQYNGQSGWMAIDYLRMIPQPSLNNSFQPVAFDSTSPTLYTYDEAHLVPDSPQKGSLASSGITEAYYSDGPSIGNNEPKSKNYHSEFDCNGIALSTFFPIQDGYSYRIDPPVHPSGQPHIHIKAPDGKEWKQRADGSPYEPNHQSTKAGDPPRKIREWLKKVKDDNDNNKKGGGGAKGPDGIGTEIRSGMSKAKTTKQIK